MLTLLLPAGLLVANAVALQNDREPVEREGWRLVWQDEFDVDGAPDPAKWSFDTGFIRNEELQLYTDRPKNGRVENGHLVIEGRRERVENPAYDPDFPQGQWNSWMFDRSHADYTAANLVTKGKFEFTYGRIEMRAKLPVGQGMWPAFWTLGSNIGEIGWPRCGEIDVMEWVGKEPDFIHGTVHFNAPDSALAAGEPLDHKMSGDKIAVEDVTEGFHTYAAEWSPEEIKFFFDGENYFTFDVSKADPVGPDGTPQPEANPFRKPHYLLLNLAIGGMWGGPVGEDVEFPQQYVIDYVRVYERDE